MNKKVLSFPQDQTVLIIYDIANDKRRRKVVKALESYGNRVQESAFECVLSKSRRIDLENKIMKIISENEDNIRFYQLNQYNSITVLGIDTSIKEELFGFV